MVATHVARVFAAVQLLITLALGAPAWSGQPPVSVNSASGSSAAEPMDQAALAEALSERGVRIIDERSAAGALGRSGSAQPSTCEWWTTMQTTRILVCQYDDVFQARQAFWRQSGPIIVRRLFHRGRVLVRLPAGASPDLQAALSTIMEAEGR
jgi:hypothetical protein